MLREVDGEPEDVELTAVLLKLLDRAVVPVELFRILSREVGNPPDADAEEILFDVGPHAGNSLQIAAAARRGEGVLRHVKPFQRKEPELPPESACKSGQIPVAADYPVAGDQNADRIVTDRAADRLCRHARDSQFPGDFGGDGSVGGGLAARNAAELFPDRETERGAGQMNRRRFTRILPRKITFEPLFRRFQHRQGGAGVSASRGKGGGALVAELHSGQEVSATGKGDYPQRRAEKAELRRRSIGSGTLLHRITPPLFTKFTPYYITGNGKAPARRIVSAEARFLFTFPTAP